MFGLSFLNWCPVGCIWIQKSRIQAWGRCCVFLYGWFCICVAYSAGWSAKRMSYSHFNLVETMKCHCLRAASPLFPGTNLLLLPLGSPRWRLPWSFLHFLRLCLPCLPLSGWWTLWCIPWGCNNNNDFQNILYDQNRKTKFWHNPLSSIVYLHPPTIVCLGPVATMVALAPINAGHVYPPFHLPSPYMHLIPTFNLQGFPVPQPCYSSSRRSVTNQFILHLAALPPF